MTASAKECAKTYTVELEEPWLARGGYLAEEDGEIEVSSAVTAVVGSVGWVAEEFAGGLGLAVQRIDVDYEDDIVGLHVGAAVVVVDAEVGHYVVARSYMDFGYDARHSTAAAGVVVAAHIAAVDAVDAVDAASAYTAAPLLSIAAVAVLPPTSAASPCPIASSAAPFPSPSSPGPADFAVSAVSRGRLKNVV